MLSGFVFGKDGTVLVGERTRFAQLLQQSVSYLTSHRHVKASQPRLPESGLVADVRSSRRRSRSRLDAPQRRPQASSPLDSGGSVDSSSVLTPVLPRAALHIPCCYGSGPSDSPKPRQGRRVARSPRQLTPTETTGEHRYQFVVRRRRSTCGTAGNSLSSRPLSVDEASSPPAAGQGCQVHARSANAARCAGSRPWRWKTSSTSVRTARRAMVGVAKPGAAAVSTDTSRRWPIGNHCR